MDFHILILNPPESPFTKGENAFNSLLRKKMAREDLVFLALPDIFFP